MILSSQGLAVYCGEEGGERSAASLLQVLSEFALSLENGVKKYDKRIEAEKKKAAKEKKNTEKGKENNRRNPTLSPKKLLKASCLQPQVGLTDRVKKLNAPNISKKGKDPMKELLNAIEARGGSEKSTKEVAAETENQTNDPKQALLASIRNRRGSLPSKRPPDGVSDRVKHINTNIVRKESRVMLVHRVLSEAPASVRQGELSLSRRTVLALKLAF